MNSIPKQVKRLTKNVVLYVFSIFFPGLGDRGCILMYHSVAENSLFFTTHPKEFVRQMEYLFKKKYKVIPLSEMCDRVRGGLPIAGMIAITFDDGYEDNYINTFPVLKKYQFPATIFIPTRYIGKEADFKKDSKLRIMKEDQIREMQESGLISFMPHTRTHSSLDKITFAEAVEEIKGSRTDLENITRTPANIFSYPKGRFTEQIIEYLRTSSDWLGAVTSNSGLVHVYDGPFKLRRVSVDAQTPFFIFRSKLSRAIDVYQSLKKFS